jgi:hypothetical protein
MVLKRCSVFAAIAAAISLSACAKPPGSIAATAVSSSEYEHLSCNELVAEMNTNRAELDDAEDRQRGAVAGDAAGVFLVLIPPSAFLGDASDDVAREKGEQRALQRAYERDCV